MQDSAADGSAPLGGAGSLHDHSHQASREGIAEGSERSTGAEVEKDGRAA